MRKYLVGFIFGIALTLSFNVYAAVESLVGKQVQGEVPVKLNGAQLDNKAAIIDGSSYLPVRAIGEALGLNVDFQNNEAVLNQKPKEEAPKVTGTTPTVQQAVVPTDDVFTKSQKLDELIKKRNDLIKQRDTAGLIIADYEKNNKTKDAVYDQNKKLLEDANKEIDSVGEQSKQLLKEIQATP